MVLLLGKNKVIKTINGEPALKGRDNPHFSRFVEQLFLAENFEQAFSAFEKHIQQLGFSGVLYAYIPALSLDTNFPKQPVYHYSDSYSPDYIAHYMEANYYQHDPIIKAMQSGYIEPLDWLNEIKTKPMNAAAQKVILTALKDYQMIHGLTIPTLSGNHGVACVSVISQESLQYYKLAKQENLQQLQLCARLLHSVVVTNGFHLQKFILPLIAELTPTERRFLRKLCEGKKLKQIALELGLKEKYMDKVMRHLLQKLSPDQDQSEARINRDQLLYYMGQMNILDLL